ncbi:DoxX family protein [Pontibacter qinzhouensis]|uniref:DoxX family protein n=1 Tax=Pontibacter qinzhouensis TaxID=2603253 RepID=A0A5C8K6I9_9BACT|nr:DoxX family protein [Pontibacter qinzhouensis]TXK47437.1 DoxX family protein [Pontibacter qinzhouensis]
MRKRDKIIYWIATIWLCLGMVSTGIVQLIRMEEEVQKMNELGYPAYFLTIIGVWKLLGAIAVLIPGVPLVKEWAYAGFFFLMTGAIFSHFANSDNAVEYFGPALLLVLTIISWSFSPANRKLIKAAR